MGSLRKHRSATWTLAGALVYGVATGQQTVTFRLTARPSGVEIEPGKTVHNGWLFNGTLPGPLVRVREGDRLRVILRNELPEATTIHFHGLPVPLRSDGVPMVSQGPVGVGQQWVYEFSATPAGTYWYHPHVDLQIDRGLVAPLIIDPKDPGADPRFDREFVLCLDDWLRGAPTPGGPDYTDFLINGRTSKGQTPLVVKRDEMVRIRFLNVSGATNFVFTVDGHPMQVSHADGQPVVPVTTRAIPIGVGERYDVYLTCNNPGRWSIAVAELEDRKVTLARAILAYEGAPGRDPTPDYVPPWLRSAPLLGYHQLAAKRPIGPIVSKPDRIHDLVLGIGPGGWAINGQSFPNASPLDVQRGEQVRFHMINKSGSFHPMHLHGHFFRVLGSAGGTTAPLIKDTVLVAPGSSTNPARLSAEFLADNPGNWPYHCHMIYHMVDGMMRLVRYVGTDTDADGLSDGEDFAPNRAWPVGWTVAPGAYRPGTKVNVIAQWRPGEIAVWMAGPQMAARDLGDLGVLRIDPKWFLGIAAFHNDRTATLPVALPNDRHLTGAWIVLQAAATHSQLPPGIRLSTATRLDIR